MEYAYKYGDKLIRVDVPESNAGLGVTNRWNKLNMQIEYGITDKVTVVVDFPYSTNAREEAYRSNFYTANGIGDVSLRGRYWLRNPDPRVWNLYVTSGVTFPSGSDAERDINGNWKKPYIVPGSGQWSPQLSVGINKGFGIDEGVVRFNFSATCGRVWTLGKNDAGYDSADAYYASVGGSYIPFHFGKEHASFAGVGFFVTGIRIAGWDTRDGIIVSNTGGKWIDINPGIFFSPDGGRFTVSLNLAHPVFVKVHSLQTTQSLSYGFGMAYRF